MKNARQAQILRLIESYEIGTQKELADRLISEGFDVTQATVSRDIREMKLRKVAGENGIMRYQPMPKETAEFGPRYHRALRDGFVSADCAGNLVVIKTSSGMAMAGAAAIDSLKWKDVLGCIAGDDVIMIVVRTPEEARDTVKRIKAMVSDL